VKKYEGLFILNTAGKEESLKEMIDKVSSEIDAAGGKVETVQKMDKRPFARVADKKFTSGFYVNYIFEIEPSALEQLQHRFDMDDDVFRVMFTIASATRPVAEAA
jgi:small subunit ribosomal protein S6